MSLRSVVRCGFLLLGCFPACAGDASSARREPVADAGGPCMDSVAPMQGFLPCDVEAVLRAKCQRCHNTRDVIDACVADDSCAAGPFPLLTFADTRRVAFTNDEGDHPVFERMAEVVESGDMPFQLRNIQPPVQPLTEAEKRVLLDWVAACAPSADAACAP